MFGPLDRTCGGCLHLSLGSSEAIDALHPGCLEALSRRQRRRLLRGTVASAYFESYCSYAEPPYWILGVEADDLRGNFPSKRRKGCQANAGALPVVT